MQAKCFPNDAKLCPNANKLLPEKVQTLPNNGAVQETYIKKFSKKMVIFKKKGLRFAKEKISSERWVTSKKQKSKVFVP